MAVDATRANAVSNTIAQSIKAINDTVGQANAGTQQAAQLAQIQQAVSSNSDLFTGIGGADNIEQTITKLSADISDGNAAAGGNGTAFNADMNTLVTSLNQSGFFNDVGNGQGHFDQTSVVTAAGVASGLDAAAAAVSASTGSVASGLDAAAASVYAGNVASGIEAASDAASVYAGNVASGVEAAEKKNELAPLSSSDLAAAPQSVRDAAAATTGAQVYRAGTNYDVVMPGTASSPTNIQEYGGDGTKGYAYQMTAGQESTLDAPGSPGGVQFMMDASNTVSASTLSTADAASPLPRALTDLTTLPKTVQDAVTAGGSGAKAWLLPTGQVMVTSAANHGSLQRFTAAGVPGSIHTDTNNTTFGLAATSTTGRGDVVVKVDGSGSPTFS